MRLLNPILTHPQVEPRVAAVLRRQIVDEPWRFVARELSGRRIPAIYRVRENGLTARVVHNTGDVSALDQSFYSHAHEPPPGALSALRGLGHPVRALDVGANVGLWGLWLHSRFPQAQVDGLEPDPVNIARHRHQIALNGLQDRWTVTQRAATTAGGTVSFRRTSEGSTGSIVAPGTADALTVDGVDIFSLLDGIDLLKIDIEGGEWPILADERFCALSVPVVMLEYHAAGAPDGEPRRAAERALESADYRLEPTQEFRPGYGTVWGHRSR